MTQLSIARAGGKMIEFSAEQRTLIRRTFCVSPKGTQATDDEFERFIATCERTGLDPFSRQIYAVFRWDGMKRREVMTEQVSIDGLRLIAERSGQYAGQIGPEWCGKDGAWRDIWTGDGYPFAARVGVLKSGFQQPLMAVAKWSTYVQTLKEGGATRMWAQMPDLMIGKCAEALALRRAFPFEMSGLYTSDEMAQADIIDVPSVAVDSPKSDAATVEPESLPYSEPATNHQNGKRPTQPSEQPAPAPAPVGDDGIAEPATNEPPEEETPAVDQAPDGPARADVVRRYRQLAAVASERGHAKAGAINAADPEALDDAVLAASVRALEGYFPGVPFGFHGNPVDPAAGPSIQRSPCQAEFADGRRCDKVLIRDQTMEFGGAQFTAGALMDRGIHDYGRILCAVDFRAYKAWADANGGLKESAA